MDSFLGIKYKLTSSENWDEFMQAVGVDFATRKLGNLMSPCVELSKVTDGKYILKTMSTVKDYIISFVEGEEFDDETPDGKKARSTITFDSNKLVQVIKGKEREIHIVREFGPEEMKATFSGSNVVSVRTYKKV